MDIGEHGKSRYEKLGGREHGNVLLMTFKGNMSIMEYKVELTAIWRKRVTDLIERKSKKILRP